jgi:hypothetical protein
MDPLIASIIITWLIMRTSRHVRDEWRHSRDTHGGHLSREHPDWSPGRVRRNARRRARGDWLDELGNGFPTLRRTLAEDRLLARTTRAEEEAAGEERVRGLRKRLDIAVDKREAERREAGTQPDPVTWGPGPDHPQVPPGSPGTPHTPAVVPPLPADVGKPQPGVTHHDHTYVPLGGCPECGGPGPGIPLVRGDRVTGTAADGTRIPGTVISSDGETAVTELDGGRRITSPAVVPVGPLPAPPPACGVGACQNPVAPGRLFCAGCEAAIYAPRADAKPDDSAWLEPGE